MSNLHTEPKNNNQGWLGWFKSFVPSLFEESKQEEKPAPKPTEPKNNNQGWLGWFKSFVPSLFSKRSEAS